MTSGSAVSLLEPTPSAVFSSTIVPPYVPIVERENLRTGLRLGTYCVRLASGTPDRLAAFRLRFVVFNLELSEGLDAAYETGYDTDRFDDVCDHLIVEHEESNTVVGTYRLQTGNMAHEHFGYYSEQEFDFTPYEPIRDQVIELGRACIHRDHRSTEVLHLLWRGIAQYAVERKSRYLIGCCSLTSQDAAHGTAVYGALSDFTVDPIYITNPQPEFTLPLVDPGEASARPPKLLRTYLAIGCKVCGPPAIDREFKTIDFLTLVDLENLHPKIFVRFFPNGLE